MNRREFLSLGAGAFAARAIADLHVFETGIADESVLKVEPLEIDLGLGKAFRAFHFSDTHLNFFDAVDFSAVDRPKKDRFNARWVRFPQAVQSFYASLDYAKRRNLPLLHTGDLIDFVTDGNERFLAHNVADLDWHYALGNHEYQSRAPEQYDPDEPGVRARLQRHFKTDLTVASRIIGGANFVAFDNARKNVREETVRRVKAEFEKPYPVVLMCHIPPFYTPKFLQNSAKSAYRIARGLGRDVRPEDFRPGKNVWDSYDQTTRDFWTWVQAKPKLKAVLSGHAHIAESDGFSETAQMYVAGGNYEGCAYEIVFK